MNRKRYGRRKRRSTGRRKTFTRNFAKRVRSSLYKMAETKQTSQNLNITLGAFVTIARFINNVPQGSGDFNRIGNQIMARNWQTKLNLEFASAVSASKMKNLRVFIVWPRKLSDGDAQVYINQTNFPLDGLVDQDNWIILYDKTFTMIDTPVYGAYKRVRIVFNKKMFAKLEFASGPSTIPTKNMYIIFSWGYNQDATITCSGYTKVSYKDI